MAEQAANPNTSREDGEGSYRAAQNFRAAQEEFATDKTKVEQKARKAANALDGAESVELEQAQAAARDGHSA